MALTPGTALACTLIDAPLGIGGMGEVNRATDATLGRQVAIKVLPEAVAQHPERLAQFEREAKTLASLNHPNIGQLVKKRRSVDPGFSGGSLPVGKHLLSHVTTRVEGL